MKRARIFTAALIPSLALFLAGCGGGSSCGIFSSANSASGSTCASGSGSIGGAGGGGGGLGAPVELVYAAQINTGQQIGGFELDASNNFGALPNFTPISLPGQSVSTTFAAVPVTATTGFLYGIPADGTIRAFSYAADGSLTALAGSPFPSGGIVNIVVDPTEKFLVGASTGLLHVFAIDATGALSEISGSPFTNHTSGSEIAFANGGTLLYSTDSLNNTLGAFSFAPTTGALTEVSGSPFAMAISFFATAPKVAGGFMVATSGAAASLQVFSIGANGVLTPVTNSPFKTTAGAFQVFMDPAGMFVYVSEQNAGANTLLEGFGLNSTTGALTAMPGSPFASIFSPDNFGFGISGDSKIMILDLGGGLNAFTLDATTGVPTVVGTPQGSFTAFPVITP